MRVFKDNEELKSLIVDGNIVIDDNISCNFNIDVNANIRAWDIKARDIKAWDINANNVKAWYINANNVKACYINANNVKAWDIKAWDINANDIKARNISYYAFCIAYTSIECESIKGRRENSFHKCLDGKLTIKEKLKEITIKGETFLLNKENIEELKNQLK